MTWIKRPGSAPPQFVSGRDEETGDRSEIQTRIEEISEVDRDEGVPAKINVRKSGPL